MAIEGLTVVQGTNGAIARNNRGNTRGWGVGPVQLGLNSSLGSGEGLRIEGCLDGVATVVELAAAGVRCASEHVDAANLSLDVLDEVRCQVRHRRWRRDEVKRRTEC